MDTNIKINRYRELLEEIKRRSLEPFEQISFIVYFLVAILGLGGLGVWVELHHWIYDPSCHPSLSGLRTAVNTFYPALAGASALQLVFSEQAKHIRSFAILLFVAFIATALWLAPAIITDRSAIIAGSIASLAALWCWCIANADAPEFKDTDPDAAVGGGDPAMKPLPGELNGFQH